LKQTIELTLPSAGTVAIDNISTSGSVDVEFHLQAPNSATTRTSVWVRNAEGLNASGLDFAVAKVDDTHLEANLQLIATDGDLGLNVDTTGDADSVDLVGQWIRLSAARGAFYNGDGTSRFQAADDGLTITADDLVIVTGGDLGLDVIVDRLDVTGTGLYQLAPTVGSPGDIEAANLDIQLSKRDITSCN